METTKKQIETQKLSWTEYFKYRVSKNRVRPIVGIPGFFIGVGLAFTQVAFSPFEPVLGVDPAFLYAAGALTAGVGGYQIGGATGSMLWRSAHRSLLPQLDQVLYRV